MPRAPQAAQKLFTKDWLEIVALAEGGRAVPDIAKAYGVDASVIYRGLKKRRVNLSAIAKRLEMEEAEKTRNELLAKIRETKDNDYRFTKALQQKVVSIVFDAEKKGMRIGDVIDDVKAVKLALDAVKSGTDNKWRILGLDRENEDADSVLPELPIRELTEDEVRLLRERQDLEDGIEPPEDPDLPEDEEPDIDIVSEGEDEEEA